MCRMPAPPQQDTSDLHFQHITLGWICYDDGKGKATSGTDDLLGSERMSAVYLWSGSLQGFVEERNRQGLMI